MIIRFVTENWRSFRDEAELNMTATRERQHNERLPIVQTFDMKLLPVAAIYGANAAGKTKFIEALAYFQQLIIDGTGTRSGNDAIQIPRFKLDTGSLSKPTKFAIDVIIEDSIYSYSVSLLSDRVLEEKLIIEDENNTYDVFDRNDGRPISFDHKYFSSDDLETLRVIEKVTRKNQLFLTQAIQLNMNKFAPLYEWFANKLIIITPELGYAAINRLGNKDDVMGNQITRLIKELGTGIDHFELIDLDGKPTSLEMKAIQANEHLLRKSIPVRAGSTILINEDGEIVRKKLLSIHQSREGNNVPFELGEESEGTIRMLDLAPAFWLLKNEPIKDAVIVIDELDRSLHSNLLEWLIKYYLNSCNERTRSQLIFTTHDVTILTQEIFRRDELWGIDKDFYGASNIYSFRDFKDVRRDKDIRKLYLSGFIGAVPKIIGRE